MSEIARLSPSVPHPMASARNQAFVALFKARWTEFERRSEEVSWFEEQARRLNDTLGWIADEIEARRQKEDVGCDG
jgi:hypothetical protein